MTNEDRRPSATEVRPHLHNGPRTGQTPDDAWVMTCSVCGVEFVEGMEELDAASVREMMEILYG